MIFEHGAQQHTTYWVLNGASCALHVLTMWLVGVDRSYVVFTVCQG